MPGDGFPLPTPDDCQELNCIPILDHIVLGLLLAVYKHPGNQVGIDAQGEDRGTNGLTCLNGGFFQVTNIGFQHAERANRSAHRANYNEVRRLTYPNLVVVRKIMRPGWIN